MPDSEDILGGPLFDAAGTPTEAVEASTKPDREDILGGPLFDAADAPDGAVDVEQDKHRFVPNDLSLPLHDLALRPGAHHRVSFRSTPGTSVTIRLRAHAWLSLEVLNASRVFPPPDGGVSAAASPAPGAPAGAVVSPAATTPVADGGPSILVRELLSRVRAVTSRPFAAGGAFDTGVVFGPDSPLFPDPLPPPEQPTLPVEVVVSVRDGAELHRSTLLASPSSPSPVGVTVGDIGGNEVIDVTFVNPNDVPVICTSCTVNVARRVRTSITRTSTEFFERTFNGAISSLCPTIEVTGGSVAVLIKGDIADELGVHKFSKKLPASFTGKATFEATDIKIMGQDEMVRLVIPLLQRRVKDEIKKIAPANGTVALGELRDLKDHARDFVDTDEFVDGVASAYFDESGLDAATINELVAPDLSSSLLKERVKKLVGGLLEEFPLLFDTHRHRPADPAFSAEYALKEIRGEWGPIGLEIHEIRASLFLAFNHLPQPIPAPFGDLLLDQLTVGTIRPAVHLDLEIADLDFEIEVPLWAEIASVGVLPLAEFLVEQGLNKLGEFLAGEAEKEVPKAVHEIFAAHTEEFGQQIADAFVLVANRDHKFHRIAANRGQFVIATIDPHQLRIPHDPSAGRRPSPLEEIDQQVAPVLPIDHVFSVPSPVGASPEELLGKINHFVFVMMENRSFDHMLGYLSHPDHGARSDIDGLDGSARLLGGDLQGTRAMPLPGPNLSFRPSVPHDDKSTVRQINAGQMNGFASEYSRRLARARGLNPRGFLNDPERVLRYQTPDVVSTLDRLARRYTICDRWFASVPAGTYPNRACYYSGVTPSLTNGGIVDDIGYLSDLTLFDFLNHIGVDWKVFDHGMTFLRGFRNFRMEQERIRPYSELSFPLPAVTFIDPSFTGFPSAEPHNDDHAPTDVLLGQAFLDDLVRRVENGAGWESTMLVIIYDEHGGFADHVPPPGAPGSSHPPGETPAISLAHAGASTYGVRVPAVIVSPLARLGGVAHQIFDHATIFRTLIERFGPQHLNSKIIPERVRRSRHLGEVLTNEPQPPRVAGTAAPTPQVVAMANQRRRSRVTFDEPLDREDAAWFLKHIGVPRAGSRPRR